MTSRGSSGPRRPPHRSRLAFWPAFAWQTLTARRLLPLAARRLSPDAVIVHRAEHLPRSGSFVLTANHYRAPMLDVIAALLLATAAVRPDAAGALLLVSGRRASRKGGRRAGLLTRPLVGWVFRRWEPGVLRIPLGNVRASTEGLRVWRQRAREQPSLVFPEAQSRPALGAIRPGAGRWLAALGVPAVPTGIWPEGGRWQVRFGPPVAWSPRPELRDHQLGLAIADLLPPDLAPAWQDALTRWRRAHRPAVVAT